MSKITITEALAEIKTIDKRLEKKRQFVLDYLVRQERIKDPLERDGGSVEAITRERQSIAGLEERKVQVRRAVQVANEGTELTVGKMTRAIADWLVWRREVAPDVQRFLQSMSVGIHNVREDAKRKGLAVITSGDIATNPADVIVNVDERALAESIEMLEEVLGGLDGQLSLKNATTYIEL